MKLGGSMERRRSGGRKRRAAGKKAKRRTSGSRSMWLLLVLGIGVSLFGSGVGYLFATRVLFPMPEREVTDLREVPRLSGMEVADARLRILEEGFIPGTPDSVRHPTAPRGMVLGQSPLPGQLMVHEGEVRLTISSGPEIRPIPDVARLRGDRAITVLEASGFSVVADSVESEIPQGRVVSINPAIGTEVALPREVRLVVSLGPPMVEVPEMVGLQEEEARSLLDSLGLTVGEVETRFRFGMAQGQVLEQDPPSGTQVERGTAVRLIVGRRGFF